MASTNNKAATSTKVAILTGAAKDDLFSLSQDDVIFSGNVIANDPGSAKLVALGIDQGATASASASAQNVTLDSGALISIEQGSLRLDAANAHYNALAEGEAKTETVWYKIQMANGAVSVAKAQFTIVGKNDAASIAGDMNGLTVEDGMQTVTGTLAISDVDHDEAHARSDSGSTDYGSYTVDTDGHWSFTLDNTKLAVQQLAANETLVDHFTVTSKDGTATQEVVLTIAGSNDVASMDGDVRGAVTEDGTQLASGTLTVTDVDHGEAQTRSDNGTTDYGSYMVDTNGQWTFALDNALNAVQQLGAGETMVDHFTVTSRDGTATREVEVIIAGSNDVASIGGDITGVVNEDGVLISDGTLKVKDIDNGEARALASTGATTFGEYTVDMHGRWSFALDNSSAKVQALGANDIVYDSFTVTSLDGSATQTVSIEIHGTDEAKMVALPEKSPVPFTTTTTTSFTSQGDSWTGTASNDYANGLSGKDYLIGKGGDDFLVGGNGDDTLNGGDGNDYLLGQGNGDTLSGGNGNDVLDGGQNDDNLYGQFGQDYLTGGTQKDVFFFSAVSEGLDVISDFESGTDRLDFSLGITFASTVISLVDTDSNGIADSTLVTVDGHQLVILLGLTTDISADINWH